jgi:hypothetical protein
MPASKAPDPTETVTTTALLAVSITETVLGKIFMTYACFSSGVTATAGVLPNRNRRHDHVGGRVVTVTYACFPSG